MLNLQMKYILYTDGGSRGNPGKAAVAAFLFDENDRLVDFDSKYIGIATNNQAEYEGLILGMQLATKNNVKELEVRMDSELVVKQINGEYKVKDDKMLELKKSIDKELKNFDTITLGHVRREFNKFSDKLVNHTLDLS